MEKIEAWRSKSGAIHTKPTEALLSDLQYDMREAWQSVPHAQRTGDPTEIAFVLARSTDVRRKLMDALERFESGMEEVDRAEVAKSITDHSSKRDVADSSQRRVL